MNPRTDEQRLADLEEKVRELELNQRELEAQAKVVRFVGGAVVLAVISLGFRVLFGG